MSNYNFHLPDIGEGLHEAEILNWFVSVGDKVKEHDNLAEIQTDKAAVEITSPVSGTIAKLGAEVGETIKVGEIFVSFKEVNKIEEAKTNTEPKSTLHVNEQTNEQSIINNRHPSNRVLAAPSVRKRARELNIDLNKVPATGPNNRVLAKDLQRFIEVKADNTTENITIDYKVEKQNTLNNTKVKPISGLRRIIYKNMQKTVSNSALCTGMDEVNVTKLVQIRNELKEYGHKLGIRLTYLPFVIKAVSLALKKYPIFNAHIDDEKMNIEYHEDIHIGIATATKDGLIVPVIRYADKKTIIELAKEISQLADRARTNQLSPKELTGSTFTISNTGSTGGQFATPIINYPELAILGVHQIKKKPIIKENSVSIGYMMGMSITFDHRVIDGEPSGLFMNEISMFLKNPEKLLLHF